MALEGSDRAMDALRAIHRRLETATREGILALGLEIPDPFTAEAMQEAVDAKYPGKMLFAEQHDGMHGVPESVVVKMIDKPDATPLLTDAEITQLRDALDSPMLQGAQLALSRVVDPGHLPRLSRGASRAIVVVLEAAPRLLDFTERARKLLLAEEWIEDEAGWHCPTCGGYKPGTGQQDQEWVKRTHPEKLTQMAIDKPPGHKPDCELAALLGLK